MASDARKILLVEDEKAIRDAVAAYLEREGYWVVGVGDGQSAVEEFEKHQFDLIVLDLMLPKLSGERVCRAIRDTSDVPIIMLTAKGEVEDRIIGLELGADDYLIKPFSPRELVARVRALFRRTHIADEPQVEVLDFGDLVIDISGHKILVENKEADLTASEFKLLTTCAPSWAMIPRSPSGSTPCMAWAIALRLRRPRQTRALRSNASRSYRHRTKT